MTWTTFHLRVDTPLFNDDSTTGAEQAGRTSVRVPSIRGVLRYWYRAIAAGHGIDTHTDLTTLAESEEEVFGSTRSPSPIRMRIANAPSATYVHDWADEHDGVFYGARYLLGQGLWRGNDLTRPCLQPGARFDLQVRFTSDSSITNRFMLALWAWLTYGGLGARTRRGFGRLTCLHIDNPPTNWTSDLLRPPTDPTEQDNRWERVIPPDVRDAADNPFPTPRHDDNAPLPACPALSHQHWKHLLLYPDPMPLDLLLHEVGTQWREFRTASHDGQPQGSPEWQTVVMGHGRDFPVAALGLPVNYFRHDPRVNAGVNVHVNGQETRRASPVWLTPTRHGDTDQYIVFTHVFHAELAPENATLRLTKGNQRDLPLPTVGTLKDTWNAWLDGTPRPTPPHPSGHSSETPTKSTDLTTSNHASTPCTARP